MKSICIIIFSFIISSCANIPIGTMIQLSTFDENSFLELNPQDLKTKIQIDQPVQLKDNQTKISISFNTSKGEKTYQYPVEVVSKKVIPSQKGFFISEPEKTEYEFVLSKEAVENVYELQRKLHNEQLKELSFSVDTKFKDIPANITDVTLSIFINLSQESNYITLIDRASVKINRDG